VKTVSPSRPAAVGATSSTPANGCRLSKAHPHFPIETIFLLIADYMKKSGGQRKVQPAVESDSSSRPKKRTQSIWSQSLRSFITVPCQDRGLGMGLCFRSIHRVREILTANCGRYFHIETTHFHTPHVSYSDRTNSGSIALSRDIGNTGDFDWSPSCISLKYPTRSISRKTHWLYISN